MRLKSFEMPEARGIGQEEASESRGLPILWKGIRDKDFQI